MLPNDLLPTLDTSETITVATQEWGNVTIKESIFYLAPDNFVGSTAPMAFDISSVASYEITKQIDVSDAQDGSKKVDIVETHSAATRGETVLYAWIYRGGDVADVRYITSIRAALAS